MRLRALEADDCFPIHLWRNESKVGLRTSGPESYEQQEKWYLDLKNKKDMRFWAIEKMDEAPNITPAPVAHWSLIGQGGFTSISFENRIAEISLIMADGWRGKGLGEQAVDLLLEQAFKFMNLHSIYGEVYMCNKEGVSFWEKIVKKYRGEFVILRDRKFWDGHYSDSLYFTIWGDEWTVAIGV